MIEVRHDRALYLPQADLWLDPRLPKPLAFVSHAHSDHTGRHEKTIATPTTLRLMEARMGEWTGEKIPLPFGESRDFENFRLRLLPAGHVLGSAQAFVDTEHGSLLYTGDFKLRRGISSETAAHCQSETLVMETTYGLPRYVFPPFEEVMAQILKFCIETLEENSVPVLLGYSLGKAQEILGLRLLSIHNLHFYLGLTRQAREHILAGTFQEFRRRFVAGYKTRSDTP